MGKRKVRPREQGFTLLELVIVVVIIGIGSALAVPNYLEWYARYQLRQAITEIQSQLAFARMAAMNRNTQVAVTVSMPSTTVQVAATDPAGTTVILPQQLPSHVTAVTPLPSTVTFTSLGLRSGGGGGNQQITVTNDRGLIYSLRITPGGKASWCASATCP